MAVTNTFTDVLHQAGCVSSEAAPESRAELVELLRENGDASFAFVGAGHRGGPSPAAPSILVRFSKLDAATEVSVESLTLRLPAACTWAKADELAAAHGLSLEHLVDTWPESTIGGTLAAKEILPPLWLSATARSVCLGLSALSLAGESYDHIQAPRTASGPDLRALFLGCHGANGPIISTVLEARRVGSCTTLIGPLHVSLQSLLNEFGSVLSARGDHAGVAVRVRIDSNLGRLVAERVRELGIEEGAPSRPDRPETVLTVPWRRIEDARAASGDDAKIVALGPTHVAFGSSFAARDTLAAPFDDDPLSNWVDYSPRRAQ